MIAHTQTLPTNAGQESVKLPGLRQAVSEGGRRLLRAIAQRRIPGSLVQWLCTDPDHPRLWRFARRFYPHPVAFYKVFGFFPLPVKAASYKEFKHIGYHPVRAFSRTDVPGSVYGTDAWLRWTSELPEHLQDPVIPSCHTVFLRDGLADAHGDVFSAQGTLVMGASSPFRENVDDYYVSARIFPSVYQGHCVAVLTSLLQNNYYHWLMDVLPRIHMLRSQGLRPDKFYLQRTTRFQIETLALLGIRDDECLTTSQYDMVSATDLVVPFHEMKAGMEKPQWVFEFLRGSFLPLLDKQKTPATPKRIYISREKARMRRVTNEDEILRILEPLGFHKVTFEQKSFLAQVALFAGAEAIITPHGAALANLAFARPGTKVIDFQPWKIQDTAFRTSRAVGIDYYYLRSSTGPATVVNNHQDITIDPGELKSTLRLAAIQ